MADAGIGAKRLHAAMNALQAGDGRTAGAEAHAALEAFGAASDRTGAAAAHQVLAIVSVGYGRFDDAIAHVDAAIPLRESTGDMEGVASLLQERMELCLRKGDIPGARDSAERQVSAWSQSPDKEGRAHAMHQLAQLLLQLGDDGRAEALVSDALWALEGPGWARARSALHLLYANIWLARNDADRALQHARTGLDEARQAKNRPAEIDALQQCGVIHASAGEYAAAKRALEEALVGRELLKDRGGRAHVLRELGGVELALDEVDDALEHFAYAAKTLREEGDVVGEVTLLQLLQTSADERDRPDAALTAARDLVDAATRTGDREAEAGAHFALATRLASMRELAASERHFRAARDIQEVIGLAHEAAVSAGMLGQVLVATGRTEEGKDLLRASWTRLSALGSEAADMVKEILDEAEVGS